MKIRNQMVMLIMVIFGIGIGIGYLMYPIFNEDILKYERIEKEDYNGIIPNDIIDILHRFSIVNKITNQTLEKFILLGGAEGVYEEGGDVFETYVLSFEDRFEGAVADKDFLDVIIEFKRARGENSATVRMVQLGLDTIEVFLDGNFIDSIRPGIEIQVKT